MYLASHAWNKHLYLGDDVFKTGVRDARNVVHANSLPQHDKDSYDA